MEGGASFGARMGRVEGGASFVSRMRRVEGGASFSLGMDEWIDRGTSFSPRVG